MINGTASDFMWFKVVLNQPRSLLWESCALVDSVFQVLLTEVGIYAGNANAKDKSLLLRGFLFFSIKALLKG